MKPLLPLSLLVASAISLMPSLSAFETNDPYYPEQWQWFPDQNGINILQAWKEGYTGEGVVIGIVDQWVEGQHEDLAPNYRSDLSVDFVGLENSEDPYITESHGVFVAGCAAARGENNIGIIGAAPYAGIAGLHIDLTETQTVTNLDQQVVDAFYYGSGVENVFEKDTNGNYFDGSYKGDAIISVKNNSWGAAALFFDFSDLKKMQIQAVSDTIKNNVVYVFAAGNDRDNATRLSNVNGDTLNSYEEMIVVAATNTEGTYTSFSNYGANVFVSAPGQDVVSTDRSGQNGYSNGSKKGDATVDVGTGNYASASGTSFASPIVAGVIALAKQGNQSMDSRWAKHALVNTSHVIDVANNDTTGSWVVNSAGNSFNNNYGFGLIDAYGFVKEVEKFAYTTSRTTKTATNTTGIEWEANKTTEFNFLNASVGPTSPNTSVFVNSAYTQAVESVELSISLSKTTDETPLLDIYTDTKIVIESPSGTKSEVWAGTQFTTEDGKISTTAVTVETSRLIYDQLFADKETFDWTFSSNAFWGETYNTENAWKVYFINKGGVASVLDEVSLKVNMGTFVNESSDMTVRSSLDVHAIVLDYGATNFTVQEGGFIFVEDAIVLNKGKITINGGVQQNDSGFKQVKVEQNGGSFVLENKGVMQIGRGYDLNNGVFTIKGGAINEGKINVQGGTLNIVADAKLSGIDLNVGSFELKDGINLDMGEESPAAINVNGGTFISKGNSTGKLNVQGGHVIVPEGATTRYNSGILIGASISGTYGSMVVEKGAILNIENTNAENGTVKKYVEDPHSNADLNSGLTLSGYYQAASESIGESGDIEYSPEILIPAFLKVAGTIDSKMTIGTAGNLIIDSSAIDNSALFTNTILVNGGQIDLNSAMEVQGVSYALKMRDGLLNLRSNLVLSKINLDALKNKIGVSANVGSLVVGYQSTAEYESSIGDMSTLSVPGATIAVGGLNKIGTGEITAKEILFNKGTFLFEVGDLLTINNAVFNVEGDATILVSFGDALPLSEVNLIEFNQVGGSEQTAKINFDTADNSKFGQINKKNYLEFAEELPQVWSAVYDEETKQTTVEIKNLTYSWESELKYDGNKIIGSSDKIVVNPILGLPEKLSPIYLEYDGLEIFQQEARAAIRTTLKGQENEGQSAKILEAINSAETKTALHSMYSQFLPKNMMSIASIHDRQASAVSSAIEMRSRELRNGHPRVDAWSNPLLGSYQFSFSTNAPLSASSGFLPLELSYYDNPCMFWVNGGYSKADRDGSTDISSNIESSNVSVGFDYAFTDNLTIGAFVGYTNATLDYTLGSTNTSSDMRSLGVYISGNRNDRIGSLYGMAMATLGLAEYDFTRETVLTGGKVSYNDETTSSTDGYQTMIYLSGGYEWNVGRLHQGLRWTTGPNFSLKYTNNKMDSFVEDENEINTLKIDDVSYNSLIASAGWRIAHRLDTETMTFMPEIRASWNHEFLDSEENIGTSFNTSSAKEFDVELQRLGKDYANIGFGITGMISDSMSVSIDYDVQLFRKDQDVAHQVNAMLKFRF